MDLRVNPNGPSSTFRREALLSLACAGKVVAGDGCQSISGEVTFSKVAETFKIRLCFGFFFCGVECNMRGFDCNFFSSSSVVKLLLN